MVSMLGDQIHKSEEMGLNDVKESCLDVLRVIYFYSNFEEVLLEIIKIHPIIINYKSGGLSTNFYIKAVRANPECYKFMGSKVATTVMEEAIEQDINLIKYMDRIPVSVMEKVVEKKPDEIKRFIGKASDSVWAVAIEQKPELIKLNEKPSQYLIKKDVSIIQELIIYFLNNASDSVCEVAIKGNPDLIKYCEKKSPFIQEVYEEAINANKSEKIVRKHGDKSLKELYGDKVARLFD